MLLTLERAMAIVRAAAEKLDYVPGEVLVKFRTGVTPIGQQRALTALRSRPAVSALRWVGDVAVLTDAGERDAGILAAQLRTQPEVAYAEPNYLYRTHVTPNDPGFSRSQWNFQALDMPRAWDINPGADASMVVAVLDSGVTTVNQSFPFQTWNGRAIQTVSVPFAVNPDLPAARLVGARDLVFWDGPVLDMDGHGTHVSSTIGEETDNGLAEAGLAYNARIMPVKVCVGYWEVQFVLSSAGEPMYAPLGSGFCAVDAIAAGLRYAADQGAKVINLSLGGAGSSQLIKDALSYAVAKGAFVSIAMGNEYEAGNPVEYPAADAADIAGAMAVGAVGRSMTRAYYSNTGPHIEIAAPGGSVLDGGANGVIWQTSLDPADNDPATVILPRFNRYVERGFQGTSMAAPHVAGVAALIVSQGVTNPAAVEAVLRRTAQDLGPGGRDQEFGFGLVQPRRALFGFGVAR
jgi:serine protease